MKIQSTFFFFLVSCLLSMSYGRQDVIIKNVSECDGNIFIESPGEYEIQFTGKYDHYVNFSLYPQLKDIKLTNTYWLSFVAPHDGIFTFSGVANQGRMDIVVFSIERTESELTSYEKLNICNNVDDGSAKIERILNINAREPFGIKDEGTSTQFVKPLELSAYQEMIILFNTTEEKRELAKIAIDFDNRGGEKDLEALKKVVDVKSKTKKFPTLFLKVRDKKTGLPVTARLTIQNAKNLNGLYNASDVYLDVITRDEFELNVDASGYFFLDREILIKEGEDREITLWVEPASIGANLELRGLYFKMGSSEFMPGSEESLKRLRDFLMLNPEIKIEINGFVNETSDKASSTGKKIARERAKRVESFLNKGGVSKKRMVARGFGNEGMIYPEPKYEWQEVANRRVEIRVID